MRILVVEDSSPIRKSVVQGLREAGYAVDEATDGEEGLRLGQVGEHDVIVLDVMLPRLDGLSVLKALRKKGCPARVLLLTAKDAPQDKVDGLDGGADDYLVKPFHFAELLARVRALVRRKYEVISSKIEIDDLQIDLSGRCVRRGGELIELSAREYGVLEFLAVNAGRIVSRGDIWAHVYDVNSLPESNVVDVIVGRVRGKIERAGRPSLIHTRRGQGYLLGLVTHGEGAS
jgi:two-component system copper resistance phosphate regulon response regulator CusR